jgi:hypothetical protein
MEISRAVAAGILRDEVDLCFHRSKLSSSFDPSSSTSGGSQDIDDRLRGYLAAQDPWVSAKAISDFCSKDMSRIQNKSNFLRGIVRKIIEGDIVGAGGRY